MRTATTNDAADREALADEPLASVVGGTDNVQLLELQNVLNKQSQAIQTLSHIAKSSSSTAQTIIDNRE